MSVGGGAQVEEVSVGGEAPVDVVGVVPLEVLLSENNRMLNMTALSDSSATTNLDSMNK